MTKMTFNHVKNIFFFFFEKVNFLNCVTFEVKP